MYDFAEPSTLPFQVPPFAQISTPDLEPAFATAMAEHLAEVRAIADSAQEPTFATTIVALERAGTRLARVSNTFFNLTGTCSTEALRAVEARVVPALTAHYDRIRLDPALFARIDAIQRAEAHTPTLAGEDAHLLRRYHLDFVLAGAGLDEDGRRRLAELNEQLSTLTTRFGQNLLQATEAAVVVVDDVAELDGLSPDAIGAAAAAAADRGLPGNYVITLVLPTGQPLLKQAGMAHRFTDALAEIPRVREELGQPIMATPFSQFVGIQAVLNVVTGDRYSLVPDEVIHYALGHYGPLAAPVDPDILDRIMSTPRAAELTGWVRPQPTLAEIRSRWPAGTSDEELLLRFMTSDEEVDAMLAAGPIRTDPRRSANEIVNFVADLARKPTTASAVRVSRPGLSVQLARHG